MNGSRKHGGIRASPPRSDPLGRDLPDPPPVLSLHGLRWEELFHGADSTLIRDDRYVGDPARDRELP